MRLFIAVNINSRSKKLIEKKVKLLKDKINTELKWTDKEQWHLTLKFIGEASVEQKEDLITALKNINFGERKEYIQFAQLGAFPNLNTAKVIYLAVGQGKRLLEALHERVEAEVFKYGFENDQRDYIPHLTLGRSRSEVLKIKKEFRQKHFINIYAQIESISLYKSELKAEGPEYIELFSIK